MSIEVGNTAGTRQDQQLQTKQETELGRENIGHANVNIDHERWSIHKTGMHSNGETVGMHQNGRAANGPVTGQHQSLQDFMLEGNPKIKGRLQELKEKYPELETVINSAAHLNIDPQQLDKQMPELKKAIQSSRSLEAEKALENLVKAVNDDGVLKLEMAKRGGEAQAAFDKSISDLQNKLESNNRVSQPPVRDPGEATRIATVEQNQRIQQYALDQIILSRSPELQQTFAELKQRYPEAETILTNLSSIKSDVALSNYPHLKQALETRNHLNPDQKIDELMQAMQADGLLTVVGEQRGAQARLELERALSTLHQNLRPQIVPVDGPLNQPGLGQTIPQHAQTALNAVIAGEIIQSVNRHHHSYHALDPRALRDVNAYLDPRLADGQRVESWHQLKREVSQLNPEGATIVKDVETQARLRAQQERHGDVARLDRARQLAEIARIANERGANLEQSERRSLNQNLERLFRGDKKLARKKLTAMEKIKEKLKKKQTLTARERLLLREERKRQIRAKRVVVGSAELRPQRPGRLSRKERRKAARSRKEA